MGFKNLRLPILVFYFSLLCQFSFGNRVHHYYSANGIFITTYGQAGGMIWDAQSGEFSVSFPYTVNSTINPVFHGTFSATKNNLVGDGRFFYSLPGVEIGKNNFSVDGNYSFGGPTIGWSDNFYFGMNYRLHFGGFQDNPDRIYLAGVNLPGTRLQRGLNPFFVCVSAGLEFYHPLFNLGSIATENGEVSVLGARMQSVDGSIRVYFQQNVVAFVPAISLERKFGNNFSVSLRGGPMIGMKESGGIRFSYMGEDADHDSQQSYFVPSGAHLDYIHLDTFNLNARFNDVPLQETPFRLSDWMFSLRINFIIN